MSLRIEIDGVNVSFPDDIKITIKRTNPFFAEKSINEGASYSFNIDKTPSIYRLLFNSKKKKFDCKIFSGSLLMVFGTIISNKEMDDKISLNLIEEGTDLRQNMGKIKFVDLDLETVVVCDEADTAAVKLTKWKDHMTDNTLNQSVEEGSHKFPKIRANQGYGEGVNLMFFNNNRYVNAYILDAYQKSPAVPNSFTASGSLGPFWFWTVSPCIKINYLFDKIMEHLNISSVINALEEIVEYKQMYHFNGYVLDKIQSSGSDYYNVHGEGYDLKDFVPDNNLYSIFELFQELFDAYFIYIGNELTVKLRKDVIGQKAVDYSKYCSSQYSTSRSISTAFVIGYEIEDDVAYFYKFDYKRRYISDPVQIYPFNEFSVNNPIETYSSSEVKLKHIPLKSFYWYLNGVWNHIADYIAGLYEIMLGWEEWTSFTAYPNPIKSSIVHENYPDDIETPTTFNCGLLRGQFDTRLDQYTSGPTYTGNVPINHMYNYNFREIQIADDFLASMTNYTQIFGNSSLYINADNGLYNTYKKQFIDFVKESEEISKTLFLPIHKAIELTSFKEPKHLIKQRNLSFEGIAKEATFSLMKDGISETTVVYVVKSVESNNHFSDDFNDDFLN